MYIIFLINDFVFIICFTVNGLDFGNLFNKRVIY